MPVRDPTIEAGRLIRQHGATAVSHAARRLLDLHADGNLPEEAAWWRILDALRTLQTARRSHGQAVH